MSERRDIVVVSLKLASGPNPVSLWSIQLACRELYWSLKKSPKVSLQGKIPMPDILPDAPVSIM